MTSRPAAVDDPLDTRRRIAIRLVASQIVFALATLPVWAVLGLAKIDGAASALRRSLLDAAVAGYPLAVVVGAVLGWRAWRRGRYPGALAWSSLPLIWLLPLAVGWYLSWF